MGEFEKMTQIREDDEFTIDLVPLIKALWKRAWLIILVAVLAAGATFGAVKLLVTPTYRSSFTAYVNNKDNSANVNGQLSSSDIVASQNLVNTYAQIITSQTLLEKACKRADMDFSYRQLKEAVTTRIANETEIIEVRVTLDDPQRAADLARAIVMVAPESISDIVTGSSMKIVDRPMVPDKQFAPNYLKMTVLGFLLGFLLAVVVIVVRELLDTHIRDAEGLEERFQIPILGEIPNLLTAEKNGYRYAYYSSRPKEK